MIELVQLTEGKLALVGTHRPSLAITLGEGRGTAKGETESGEE